MHDLDHLFWFTDPPWRRQPERFKFDADKRTGWVHREAKGREWRERQIGAGRVERHHTVAPWQER